MKTLQEVYKNSSNEVREILKTKFSKNDLGIETVESQIKSEILTLISNNIKNIKFLDEEGNRIAFPSPRFEICDETGDWLFDINYEEENKHFWYSYYRIFEVFEFKYRINYVKLNGIMKGILEEELNLKEVTPLSPTLNLPS